MKKLSIIIFTILTLLTPVFFANASVGLEVVKTTTTTIELKASGLNPSTSYNINLDNSDNTLIYKTSMSDFNGNAIFDFSGLIPNSTYVAELRLGVRPSGSLLVSGFTVNTDKIVMKITGFSPTEGKVGDVVTVTGENFSGVDKILFGNIGSSIDAITATTITTKVPAGAVDGKITVRTVKSGVTLDLVSSNNFIIKKEFTVNSTNVTSNSANINVQGLASGTSFNVSISKNNTVFKTLNGTVSDNGFGTVSVSDLSPSVSYHVLVTAGSAKANCDFTTTKLSGATVNTYDPSATSMGLEFHSLISGEPFKGFVKNDVDAGNTTNYSLSFDITPDSGGSFLYKIDKLNSNSSYIGGIVGDVSVHFKTGFDYSLLEQTIATATDLVANSKEGISVGQYPAGSTEILNTTLQKVKTDYEYIKVHFQTETIETIQSRINTNISDLQTAIDIFKAKIIGSSGSSNPTTGLSNKAEGLIPKCPDTGCSFNELMQLINNVIHFLLFTIATPLAALGIVYAGWLYLSAGGSTENTTKAKKILLNIVIGYVIALVAWLVVNTILKSLGLDPSIDTFLK